MSDLNTLVEGGWWHRASPAYEIPRVFTRGYLLCANFFQLVNALFIYAVKGVFNHFCNVFIFRGSFVDTVNQAEQFLRMIMQ